MSLTNAGVERHEQLLDLQQTYQLGMPLWDEPTLHSWAPYMAHHQQQTPYYAHRPPTYQSTDPFRQLRNPCTDTQPWQQPPDPPDWQRNSQPHPYGYHDFRTTDLFVPDHTETAVFRAETYTVPVTMEPPHGQNQYSLPPFELRTTSQFQPPYQTQPHLMHSGLPTVDYYQPLSLYRQPLDPPDLQDHSTTNDIGHTEPLGMPRDPVMQELAPNLAALVLQVERLTADVEQLVSQMEATRHQPAPAVLHHVPPPEPAPPYELPLFGSRETLLLGQQHYTDQEMSIPSLTPQPDDPCSHFQPSEELYPIGDDEVLLEVEEFVQVANEKQLDLDLSYMSAKDIIHSSVEGSFTLSNVEASVELIVTEVDSGFGRNEFDKELKYADNIGEHNTIGISHCSMTLDTDARLIPLRIDKLNFWALNNHKPDVQVGQVEGFAEMLQVSEAEVYEWRCLTIQLGAKQRPCAFDPGGNFSPKLLFVMLIVVSWFPP